MKWRYKAMFGLNERETARKSSMGGNLRGFLFRDISLRGDFNTKEMYFFLSMYVYSQMILIVLV